MKIVFLLFIISIQGILLSNDLMLNNDEIKYVNTLYNSKQAFKRFDQLQTFLDNIKDEDLNRTLIKTNYFVNRLLPQRETKYTDNWHNIKEFFIKGKGDCEEYAIAKFQLLKEIINNDSKVYLAVVKVKGEQSFHMVTLYKFKEKFLVLDNLSWKVLPIEEREDLVFQFAFNEKEGFATENTIKDYPISLIKRQIEKLKKTIKR